MINYIYGLINYKINHKAGISAFKGKGSKTIKRIIDNNLSYNEEQEDWLSSFELETKLGGELDDNRTELLKKANIYET